MIAAGRQLAAVALAAVADPIPDWVAHRLNRIADEPALMALAEAENMLPLIHRAGVRLGDRHHPVLTDPRAQTAYRRTAAQNLRRTPALIQVLAGLEKHALPVVVLQGASLWGQVYGDAGLRPVSDVDLWIPVADPKAYRRCLVCMGYHEDPVYPNTFRCADLTLDIHRHLLWADRIGARRHLMTISPDRILDRAITIDWVGARLRCLSEPDQAMYLTLHLAKHNLGALGWMADLLLLTHSWDPHGWGRFNTVARQWGRPDIGVLLGYLLSRWTGRPLPMPMAEPDPVSRWLTRQRLSHGRIHPWASAWILPAGLSKRVQLHYWMEAVFPRRDVLEQIFADRLPAGMWRLKLLRLCQLAVKAGIPFGRHQG